VHSAPSLTFSRGSTGSSPTSDSVAANDTDVEGDLVDDDTDTFSSRGDAPEAGSTT